MSLPFCQRHLLVLAALILSNQIPVFATTAGKMFSNVLNVDTSIMMSVIHICVLNVATVDMQNSNGL